MYKLTTSTSIIRTSDNATIPADPANTDYQQYLEWVAGGNTPDPAPAPTASEINEPILSQISTLEAKQHRPLREYMLAATDADKAAALQRVQVIDAEIAELRGQLK